MSENKAVVLGGRVLADYLAQRTHALVADTVQTVWQRVPFYRSLPEEAIRTDVTAIVRRNLEVFIATVRARRVPTDDEMAPIRESARRRAEELVPLADVLLAYHLGTERWWAEITELADTGDTEELAWVGAWLQIHLRAATSAVLAGYGSVRPGPGQDDAERRALFVALTSGADAAAAAERAGVRLARMYWVVALHVAPHPDEQSADVDVIVAERRKVRRLQRELDGVGRDDAVSLVDSGGGGALIPVFEAEPGPADWPESVQYATLRRNLADLERGIGAGVLSAVCAAEPAGIPEAYTLAREVLRVARCHGRTTGVVRLADLALEYQLTRPSAATDPLARLLDPLDGRAGLSETLECYLDSAGDRTATAAALHVHPNTVVYRLRKVAELTGLEPTAVSGAVVLTAAVAARRGRAVDPVRGD
ncbi:PucR family transcriptional regulator [Gordonia iterans]